MDTLPPSVNNNSTDSSHTPAPVTDQGLDSHDPNRTRSSASPSPDPTTGPLVRPASKTLEDLEDEEQQFYRARAESQRRLLQTWQQISDKYAGVHPDEDDEIDIFTGAVTQDRGRLQQIACRDFAQDGSDANDDDDDTDLPDEDEDESGDWVGQTRVEQVKRKWTQHDEDDLHSFLQAEAEMRGNGGSKPRNTTTRQLLSEHRPTVQRVILFPTNGSAGGGSHQVHRVYFDQHSAFIPPDALSTSDRAKRQKLDGDLVYYLTPEPLMDPSALMRHQKPPKVEPQQPVHVLERTPQLSLEVNQTIQQIKSTAPPPRPTAERRPLPPDKAFRLRSAESMTGISPPTGEQYLDSLSYDSPGMLRQCVACYMAGGDREQRAVWCRGRLWSGACPFLHLGPNNKESSSPTLKVRPAPTPSSVEQQIPSRSLAQGTGAPAPSDEAPNAASHPGENDLTPCSAPDTPSAPSAPSVIPPPSRLPPTTLSAVQASTHRSPKAVVLSKAQTKRALRESGYYESLHIIHGHVRYCKLCMAAGGDRAYHAPYCRGRRKLPYCQFYDPKQTPSIVSAKDYPIRAEDIGVFSANKGSMATSLEHNSPLPACASKPDEQVSNETMSDNRHTSTDIDTCADIIARGPEQTGASYSQQRKARAALAEGASFESDHPPEVPMEGSSLELNDPAEVSMEGASFEWEATEEAHADGMHNDITIDDVSATGTCSPSPSVCTPCIRAGGRRAKEAHLCCGRLVQEECAYAGFELEHDAPFSDVVSTSDMSEASSEADTDSSDDSSGDLRDPAYVCDDEVTASSSSEDDGGGNESEDAYARPKKRKRATDPPVAVTDSQILVDLDSEGRTANYSRAPRDDPRYKAYLQFKSDGSGSYTCPRCWDEGGEWAERAMWCGGRTNLSRCVLEPVRSRGARRSLAHSGGRVRRSKLVSTSTASSSPQAWPERMRGGQALSTTPPLQARQRSQSTETIPEQNATMAPTAVSPRRLSSVAFESNSHPSPPASTSAGDRSSTPVSTSTSTSTLTSTATATATSAAPVTAIPSAVHELAFRPTPPPSASDRSQSPEMTRKRLPLRLPQMPASSRPRQSLTPRSPGSAAAVSFTSEP